MGTFTFLSSFIIAVRRTLKPNLTAKEDYCLLGIQHFGRLFQSNLAIILLDNFVTFADALFELRAAQNLHRTTRVYSIIRLFCKIPDPLITSSPPWQRRHLLGSPASSECMVRRRVASEKRTMAVGLR